MEFYTIETQKSPIIALALHDGHFIPEEVRKYMLLSEGERFKEEDPFTGELADLPNVNKVIVRSSRFYTDLNRHKDQAIYLKPEDAWGLHVWHPETPDKIIQNIHAFYDQFYAGVQQLIEKVIEQFGYFFILDIHSYNHRRENPFTASPVETHPEINLGTFYNSEKWHFILKQFQGYLSHCRINGQYPDVRENVIFKGGGMAQWVIQHFGDKGAVVSVEFKKTFMDEWTGRSNIQHIQEIHQALAGSLPLIEFEMSKNK